MRPVRNPVGGLRRDRRGHGLGHVRVALPAEQPDETKAVPAIGEVKLDLLARSLVEPAVDVAGNRVLVRTGGGLRRVALGSHGEQ